MRILLAFIFLLTVVVAKDNFLYDESKKDCNERLTEIEKQVTQLQTDLERLQPVAEMAATNRDNIEKSGKKIYDITVLNKTNNKKIADIASSLKSIKDILADSTKMMADSSRMMAQTTKDVVMSEPAVESIDLSGYVKKEELTRQSVQVDNLMDRVAVLEKGVIEMMENKPRMQADNGLPKILGEARSALYDYFEYYVIATVVLFFMMFIIIFSLVGKTRHLHLAIEELAHRN